VNKPTRVFDIVPAVRSRVPLLCGLMGPSGSGKTYSALRLATGIQRVTGGDIYVIDTEARRALHYADQFRFMHIDFRAPFGSSDYLDCITQCVRKGAGVVVTDSMSHEHEGPGGYLMTHEAEVDRMAGDDFGKRDRVKIAGWIKPAALRRAMINGIVQLDRNFVFCFRAKEKIKPVAGKQPIELGFMPIAGEELLFEMTLNCLLLPKSDGVPTWRSDNVGERLMMKCPQQFRDMFATDQALSEDTGQKMAIWAAGDGGRSAMSKPTVVESINASPPDSSAGDPGPASTPLEQPAEAELPTDEVMKWDQLLGEAAATGMKSLRQQWANVPKPMQPTLKAALDRRHKPTAVQVDNEDKPG
jgi:hypothetical protein